MVDFSIKLLVSPKRTQREKNNPQHRLLNIIIRARNYESVRGGAKKNHKHAPTTVIRGEAGTKMCGEKFNNFQL